MKEFVIRPKTYRIPCIIHNLTGYDSHLILKRIKDQKVKVIATTGEKFITMKVSNKVDGEKEIYKWYNIY